MERHFYSNGNWDDSLHGVLSEVAVENVIGEHIQSMSDYALPNGVTLVPCSHLLVVGPNLYGFAKRLQVKLFDAGISMGVQVDAKVVKLEWGLTSYVSSIELVKDMAKMEKTRAEMEAEGTGDPADIGNVLEPVTQSPEQVLS